MCRRICLRFAALAAAWILLAAAARAETLQSIELGRVQLGGELGRRMDVTIHNNLLKLNLEEDFYKPFRQRESSGGFIGLGMLLDAAVGLAAYSGQPEVLQWKDNLVAETLKLQEKDGYLGMFRPEARLWQLWDIHEMSYLIHGLVRNYEQFGHEPSLAAARKTADYIVEGWTAKPEATPGGGEITVLMAVTGLEPALLRLHKITKEPRYLDFCVKHRKLAEWDGRIVLGRHGPIGGHAYAHCSRSIAQLWLFDLQPDPRLLKSSNDVIRFLANGDGLIVVGACGDRECWHDTQDATIHLGETCATAYLLRLWDELIRRQGRSLYGDFMERAVLNALPAAQSPDGRRLRYYIPLEGQREYFPQDSYCCPGNFRRIMSVLPKLVYYRSGEGVVVNLYTASTLKTDLPGGVSLTLRQETDYPSGGRVVIHVDPSKPAEFSLALRIPRWCPEAKVTVAGQPAETAAGGRFHAIARTWRPGDRVELEMPMAWRFIRGRKAQSGRVAVLRGPVVFCANRARDPQLKDLNLREVTLVPSTVGDPRPDDSVRPGGLACPVQAWKPLTWYPHTKPELNLLLSEFPDPGGEQTYFKVADPGDPRLVDDELINLDLDLSP